MKHLEEHQQYSEQVFDGALLDVRRDTVLLPNGASAIREYVVHPGAVVIIPILPDGRLLFEAQFRYPVRQAFVELPAGKIDPGEPIERTAVRELREETGYAAATWRHLGVMHPCIGYSNERIDVFLATGLTQVGIPELDTEEFLDLTEMTLSEALDGVRTGRITDAKTIVALFWAEKVLAGAW